MGCYKSPQSPLSVLNDYQARNGLVRKLFGKSYAEYLQSPIWERIRNSVLQRFGHKCAVCKGRANQVHHAKYTEDNLRGKNYKWLSAICDTCHKAIERDENGSKRPMSSVNALFVACKKVDINPPQTKTSKKRKGGKWCEPITPEELAVRRQYEKKCKEHSVSRKRR